MTPVALSIAGSDPSGGAGIQSDVKTFHQFGVYGQAVITLLTVQNTVSVSRVEVVAPDLLAAQIEAVISDMPPAAAKTGALGSPENVRTVAALAKTFTFPLVVDPVMVSKHGTRLLTSDAEQALRKELLPCAALVTPNLPEAELLSGIRITTQCEMEKAARRIAAFGPQAVLIKGGHAEGDPVDWLFDECGFVSFTSARVQTTQTHGTGCTLSAAITAGLALGMPLPVAISTAKHFVHRAIESARSMQLRFGGFGPVNHFVPAK